MPRLSKLAQAPVNDMESSTTSSGVATPTRPEVQLRRSNRRLPQDTREEEVTREIQGRVLGIRPEGEDKEREDSSEDREETTKKGVALAIEGLARMERRLMRATKKQKSKVESSILQESSDSRHDKDHANDGLLEESSRDTAALETAQPGEASKDAVVEQATTKAKTKTKSKAAVDIDDMSVPDGPFVDEGVDDSAEVERGAARAPPVNSGYLPLPWKGRLGYVSPSTDT
jgi:UV DNA damage endonuclease